MPQFGHEEKTLTTLVTEARSLTAIDTHTQSSGVKSGVVGIFFLSCADLFWELTREARLVDQLLENHRLAFRRSFEKFYIWGTGFNPERGELDEVLNLSASLKEQTASLLAKIAVILCSDEKGLFYQLHEVAIPEMLKDQRQRLLTLLDSLETNTPDPSEDSDNESSISGDSDIEFSIDTALGDLQTFVECLVSLGFSLQRPACDPTPYRGKTAGPPPSVTGSTADMRLLKMPSAMNLSPVLLPENSRWAGHGYWSLSDLKMDFSTAYHALSGVNYNEVRAAELNTQLKPRIPRKVMSQLGDQSLQHPFTSKKVGRHIVRYEQTNTLALQADQNRVELDSNQMMTLVDQKTDKLPVAKGAPFDSHVGEHNTRCLANTRVELQRQIKEWANDENGKPIFWLNGVDGSGKSTIARTVAQTFADDGQLGASFFFKRGEGDRGTASRFFTTIAKDLMTNVPEIIPCITKAINADPVIFKSNLKDQFEKLIFQPFLEMKQPPPNALGLVIVIDALDECERENDIRVILQLLARVRSLRPGLLRIFVTSRPKLPIRLGFKQMLSKTYQDLILHNIPKETIEHDMAVFLEHELSIVSEQRSLPVGWPSKEQVQALAEIAIPLFIFAATACRYIGDKRGNPKKRLEILLQYQKSNQVPWLDRTYLPILEHLFDDEDELNQERRTSEFREIVGSIIVSETPFSIASFAHLLNIPKEDIRYRLDLLHSVLSIPVDNNMPVTLIHSSFRNFLLDTQKRGKSPFWIDEKETHGRLAGKCLQLLSSPSGLRQNMCNLTSPGTLKREVNDQMIGDSLALEVRYACRYWVHHLEQSEGLIYDGDLVDAFLRKYFLYWLEAMSLLGEVSASILMVDSLKSLTKVNERTPIFDFLHDGKRFILRNRSILEDAPLQIYSSALIFAPEESIIRKTFNDLIPIWVNKLPKVQKDWTPLLQTFEGHSSSNATVVFSPDGQLLASPSNDGTVRLWDAATGSCRITLQGHLRSVKAVVFSPDGQMLASASYDMTVRLWDAATGSCRSMLEGHSESVNAVVFSPDGQLLASASYDRTVQLWDTTTGSRRNILKGHSESVNTVVFSPDGQLLASPWKNESVRLWDAATGSCRFTLQGHSSSVKVVVFSPDGQLLASASNESTVQLWDVATGSCHSILKGHSSSINAVVFSPDGQLLASASRDKTVRLWDAATGSRRGILKGHEKPVEAVAFSPDGLLLASASYDMTVRLWDAATGSCRIMLEGHSGSVQAVVFSPGGQLLASASNDKTVRLWDAATVSGSGTLEGHSRFDVAVVFSPDGQLLASASYDKTVRLWGAATGSCRRVLKGHWSALNAVVFSPDGRLLATASYDTTVQLWNTATGLRRRILKGHWRSVNAVVFSPDGQMLASASYDMTVRLWDAATGYCRSRLEGHSESVNAIVFSPDSQLLASASWDNTVRLWYATTGVCLSTLTLHEIISTLSFSPDGSYLKTDGGNISILKADRGNISYSLSFSNTPFHQDNELRPVFEIDEWVASKGQRFLWLPPDYRPTCTAVFGNNICLGHASGNVTILGFDF